jgi:hypothetical protein
MAETKQDTKAAPKQDRAGEEKRAYAAYNDADRTQVAVFSSEISAYRYANRRRWLVVPWPFGLMLHEAIGRADSAAELEQRAAVKP